MMKPLQTNDFSELRTSLHLIALTRPKTHVQKTL